MAHLRADHCPPPGDIVLSYSVLFSIKELIVSPGLNGELIDSPIPVPGSGELLIRVVAAAINPMDWKASEQLGLSANPSDGIAGIVEVVSSEVIKFKKGDRFAALHRTFRPNGNFAEFSLAPSHAAFKISEKTFEEAAAVPLITMTAGFALFQRLGLPAPCRDYIETIIYPSKGRRVLDYREGVDAVVAKVKEALGGKPVYYAFDCISEKGSDKFIGTLLKTDEPEKCRVATVLPWPVGEIHSLNVPDTVKLDAMTGIPEGVTVTWANMGAIHGEEKDFGYVFFRYMGKGVQEGWLKAMPRKLVASGLDGVRKALRNIRDRVFSATNYVVRVGDAARIEGN